MLSVSAMTVTAVLRLCAIISVIPGVWAYSSSFNTDVLPRANDGTLSTPAQVKWVECGNNYDCANIAVPLDYHNTSDKRTYTLAVTRYKASEKKKRQGAVFLNPGGPGNSGTYMVYERSAAFSTILRGQYDLIGFDPRGANKSSPYVSCFPSAFDEQAFLLASNGLSLDLPSKAQANGSDLSYTSVKHDLKRQISLRRAQYEDLATQCRERTGDAIAFMGTEFFVRDLDYLSKLIEGEDKPINYWAVSYGTLIGQTLIKILPPSRIGRMVLDAVINPEDWFDYPTYFHKLGLNDLDKVVQTFAQSCFDAKENCILNTPRSMSATSTFNFSSPAALLSAVDATLDTLYMNPIPIKNLPSPGTAVVTPTTLRVAIFSHMYNIATWPDLAEILSEVLYSGNWTQAVALTRLSVNPALTDVPDDSHFVPDVISCTDTKPYDSTHPPPSDDQLASMILDNLRPTDVGRLGDRYFAFSLCDVWNDAAISPRKSRYSGGFALQNNTLKTPILFLSNTLDPVTPLHSALAALNRLGNNARLIQQLGGIGHTTVAHTSFCTARAIRAYFVDGKVPDKAHGFCDVDQQPWQPWGGEVLPDKRRSSGFGVSGGDEDNEDLSNAWTQAGNQGLKPGF